MLEICTLFHLPLPPVHLSPQKVLFPVSPEIPAFLCLSMDPAVCMIHGFLPPGPRTPFSTHTQLSTYCNVSPLKESRPLKSFKRKMSQQSIFYICFKLSMGIVPTCGSRSPCCLSETEVLGLFAVVEVEVGSGEQEEAAALSSPCGWSPSSGEISCIRDALSFKVGVF